MKYDILSAGITLVEMPRKEFDVPFDEIGEFVGPFPSADTCIMIDTAARLGCNCCWLGAFGNDPFSNILRNRLESDGVDLSHCKTLPEYQTRVTFVRYNRDGSREYLTNKSSDSEKNFGEDYVDSDVISQAKWIHFSGEIITLFSDEKRRAGLLKMLNSITPEQKVSLDPNDGWPADAKEIIQPFVERADLILPSEGEARTLMGVATDEEACQRWASEGKIVALKRGHEGCDIYSNNDVIHVDPFHVTSVDPTGCGDSFCAGFITGLIRELNLAEIGRLANACGALQATKMGPMEGSMPWSTVEKFIEENR